MSGLVNNQQKHLLELLEIARKDIEAGRSAERTSYALKTALGISAYDDLTLGEADDEEWRSIRIG